MTGKTPSGEAKSEFRPSYLSDGLSPLENYGLYLYLTFEEECGGEWWPLEDGPGGHRRESPVLGASRRRYRRAYR